MSKAKEDVLKKFDLLKTGRAELIKMPTMTAVFTQTECCGQNEITYYTNCRTGKRTTVDLFDIVDKEEPFSIIYENECIKRGRNTIEGFSSAYDSNLDMLVIFFASFQLTALKKGETREWEETARIYVSRNKSAIIRYKEGNGFQWKFFDSCLFLDSAISAIKINYKNIGDRMCRDGLKAARQFFQPSVNLSDLFPVPIQNLCTLFCFLSHDPDLEIEPGREQDEVDALTEYKLKDPSDYDAHKITDVIIKNKYTKNTYAQIYHIVLVLERVNCEKPVACMRMMFFDTALKQASESARIYFTSQKTIACMSDNNGGFIYRKIDSEKMTDYLKIGCSIMLNYDPAVLKGTIIECFSDMISETENENRGICMWILAAEPLLEKLWKAGYACFCREIIEHCVLAKQSPASHMKRLCGPLNMESKTLHGIFGFNKYQMDKILNGTLDPHSTSTCPMLKIKRMLTPNDSPQSIAHIDNETFDAVFNLFCLMQKKIKNAAFPMSTFYQGGTIINAVEEVTSICSLICLTWGLQALRKNIDGIYMLFGISQKEANDAMSKKWNSIKSIDGTPTNDTFSDGIFFPLLNSMRAYRDYLSMVSQMDAGNLYKPYFKTVDDIEQMHDGITKVFTVKQDERKNKKLSKAAKRVSRFVYENKNYCVIIPTCIDDFIKEAKTLHHCVDSYLDRVITDNTNIMFVRKTEAPDVPFFTVEISNEGNIEQIHGFGNRNLDTEPDLIPFIEAWQKNRSLKLNDINKIR